MLLVVLMQLAQPGVVTADWIGVDDPGRDPARDPRRLPDAGDADRRHRPVRRHGRLDGRVHHGDPDGRPGTGDRDRSWPLLAAIIAGIVNGIGVGVFKVHPLIMTLGIALVILGLMNVYQLVVVQSGTEIPAVVDWLGSGTTLPFLPNNLFLFIPLARAHHRSGSGTAGSGGCCSPSATTPSPHGCPASGCGRSTSVLYILSALLAAIAGILVAGLVKTASLALVEQSVLPAVAAAVIGGTSIMGGRGGYSGTIIGALILTVLTSLLIALQMPEAVRQILFGAIIVVVAAVYTRIVDVS